MRKKIYLFLIHFAFIGNLIFLFIGTYEKKVKNNFQENYSNKEYVIFTSNESSVDDNLLKKNTEAIFDEVDSSIN